MLKDIKDNIYVEHVLPELCKRVNRAIAKVDTAIGVHATMDNNVIKWYCRVKGVASGSSEHRGSNSSSSQWVSGGARCRSARGAILIDEGRRATPITS
jgi:hypothetical protein